MVLGRARATFGGVEDLAGALGRARNGDFKINTNPPICIPLQTVNIQIPKLHLPHTLSDNSFFRSS